MQTVTHRILEIVRQSFDLGADAAIDLDTALSDLGDSLDWVELLGSLEAAFDLRIDWDESLALDRVGDLVSLVQACAAQAEGLRLAEHGVVVTASACCAAG